MSPVLRFSYLVVGAIAIGLAAASIDAAAFHPYVGAVNPGIAIAGVGLLGMGCIYVLHRAGWVGSASWSQNRITIAGFLIAALALSGLTSLMDVAFGFPRDINVPWPQAVLFYPAIGFVAEVMLALVPLTLCVLVLKLAPRFGESSLAMYICIALAALVEPLFQIAGALQDGALSVLDVYVVVALFVFGVLQLIAFRRFGFLAMYAMRLVYYLWWHIVWGVLRLDWLF